MKTYRVAILGCRGRGTAAARAYHAHPRTEIVGLCDSDKSLLNQRQAKWGITAGYTDVNHLLGAVKPDAVAVAVPNVYHHDIVLKAIAAGCHVLCEKPIGMTVAETVNMYEKARLRDVRHMTAFTYRFVPSLRYIKHLVDEGKLGEIRHARFQRLQDWGENSVGWRQYRRMAASGELVFSGIAHSSMVWMMKLESMLQTL